MLIGDPKQAIYAFRGADVYAYLDAARAAGTQATLGVNWRSDQASSTPTTRCSAAPSSATTASSTAPSAAADAHQEPRLRGAPSGAALRVRIVHRDDRRVHLTPQEWVGEVSGASTSPRTSPPTSSPSCPQAPR